MQQYILLAICELEASSEISFLLFVILCYLHVYISMVGFEPAYAPHFGSGFDTYIYGSYFGHPVSLSHIKMLS